MPSALQRGVMIPVPAAALTVETTLPLYVPKLDVVERLEAAGKLAAAESALQNASLLIRKRWEAATEIRTDDVDARALLTAIGAEPDEILAP